MKTIITTILLTATTLSTLFGQETKIKIEGQMKQQVTSEIYFIRFGGNLASRNSTLKINDGKFSFTLQKEQPEIGLLFFSPDLYTYVASSNTAFSIEVDTTKNSKILFHGAGAKSQEQLYAFTQTLKTLEPYRDMTKLALSLRDTEHQIENTKKQAQKIIEEVRKDHPFLSTWMNTYLQQTAFSYRLLYYSFYTNDSLRKRLQPLFSNVEIKQQQIPIDFLLKEPFNINSPYLAQTTDDIEMLLSTIWYNVNELKEKEVLMKHIGITRFPQNESEKQTLNPRSYVCLLSNLTNKDTYNELAVMAYQKYGAATPEWDNYVTIVSTKIHDKDLLATIQETQKKRQAAQDYISKIKELPAASFSCEDINGQQVCLNQFKGKYVLIDIWATWCGPCKGEIPSLQKQEEAFEGENVVFLGISLDSKKDVWSQFVHDKKLKGTQIFAGKAADAISKHYGVKGIPRFILLDKEGKVLESDFLRPSDENFAKVLRSYLSK